MRPLASSASVVADAIEKAEEMLATLPYTPAVRRRQTRLAAMKTVLVGMIREHPKLTPDQEQRLVEDALGLARDVPLLRVQSG